jgi:hypothetical protein
MGAFGRAAILKKIIFIIAFYGLTKAAFVIALEKSLLYQGNKRTRSLIASPRSRVTLTLDY